MAETLYLDPDRPKNQPFPLRRRFTMEASGRMMARMQAPCSIADDGVARASALLRAHLEAPWTVARLSKSVGISRAALARRFVATFAESPIQHLTRLRMERAAELLTTTNHRLASIAPQVGYDSEFALSRAFRRHFGVPPGAYRAARRAAEVGASTVVRMAA